MHKLPPHRRRSGRHAADVGWRRTPIIRERWRPAHNLGLVGGFAPNHDLGRARQWHAGGWGPEDLTADEHGTLYAGLADGRVVAYAGEGAEPRMVALMPGRPLGVERHPAGGLVVCDADTGLHHVAPDGTVRLLADSYRGVRFALTNNAAVAADGTVYFSVSSHRWPLSGYLMDLLERSATGRLYRLDASGDVEVVAEGLVFANGVALAPDESFVAVAETGSYRIHRVWLTGPRAGSRDLLCDNLPGFPDNLTCDGELIWCAFPRIRDSASDRVFGRPLRRRLVALSPQRLLPRPRRHGLVAGFGLDGRVVRNLQDPSGRVAAVTTALRVDSRVYVGSLTESTIGVVDL